MGMFDSQLSMARTLKTWAKRSFGVALKEARIEDEQWSLRKKELDLVEYVLKNQGLLNSRMNGNCSQDRDIIEDEDMDICYAEIVNKLENAQTFWDPFDLVCAIVRHILEREEYFKEKAIEKDLCFKQLTSWLCGRALRALPSFVREPQIQNAMQIRLRDAEFSRSLDLDTNEHCDIKIVFDNQPIFAWSFCNSKNGRNKFKKKFTRKTDSPPNGLHLICPLDMSTACNYYGFLLYTDDHIDEIVTLIHTLCPIMSYNEAIEKIRSEDTNIVTEFYSKPRLIRK